MVWRISRRRPSTYMLWSYYLAKFGHFRCYYLGQVGVIIWAKLFLASKIRGFKLFLAHTHSCHFVFSDAQLSGNFQKIAFFKKRVQKLGFSNFSVLSSFFENSLFLGLLKHYKNQGFSRCLCFCCWQRSKEPKKNEKLFFLGIFVFFTLLCFCFFLFLLFFFGFVFSLEGLRVRWGGPKGHLTWP